MAVLKTPGSAATTEALHTRIRQKVEEANRIPSSGEAYNGVATSQYGGHLRRNEVNSYLGVYDKYYRKATGGTKFRKNDINNRMFNQLMIMDRATLSQIQPFISGRFIFVPGEMPRCMQILHPEETEYMRTMFQSCVKAITGWNNSELEVMTVNAMTDQNSYSVVTKQTGRTDSLTFKFITLFQGLTIYRYVTTWMQYIFNRGSSAASYPYFTTLEFSEGNHSMNGVYIVTDPSFQQVEAAALIYAMVPKSNNMQEILNQTWGDHNVQDGWDIEFKVHTIPDGLPQVMRIAQGILADFVAETELHDYWVRGGKDPVYDMMGLGDSILSEDIGKKAMREAYDAERNLQK